MRLTIKQEKFCQKYVEFGVASEAYKFAYDCEKSSDHVIYNEASLLLKNHDVAMRIEELNELHLQRHMVTRDRVIAEYSKLAFFDITKIYDNEGNLKPIHTLDNREAAAIAGIEEEEVFEGFGKERKKIGTLKKIKIADKKGALDSIAKTLGMIIDKSEITGKDGLPLAITVVDDVNNS